MSIKRLAGTKLSLSKLGATLALVAVAAWGGSKERDWQTAKLLDPDRTRYFSTEDLSAEAGRPGINTAVTSPAGYSASTNKASDVSAIHDYYIVETQDQVYLAERIRLKTAQKAKLAVTRPVKFAVEKNKLYLMNENGEEYQTKIVKQIQPDKPK